MCCDLTSVSGTTEKHRVPAMCLLHMRSQVNPAAVDSINYQVFSVNVLLLLGNKTLTFSDH